MDVLQVDDGAQTALQHLRPRGSVRGKEGDLAPKDGGSTCTLMYAQPANAGSWRSSSSTCCTEKYVDGTMSWNSSSCAAVQV